MNVIACSLSLSRFSVDVRQRNIKKYEFLTEIGLFWSEPESNRAVLLHQLLAGEKELLFIFGLKITQKFGRKSIF